MLNVAVALRASHPSDDLWVSLQSEPARRVAESLGLKASPPNVVVYAVREAIAHPELARTAKRVRQDQLLHRFLSVLFMLALIAGSIVVLGHYGEPLSLKQATIIGIILPVFACVLYWFRVHYRLHYGLTEVLFAWILSVSILRSALVVFGFDQLLQLFAAGYIFIRGLDNIGYGIRATVWSSLWERFFAERTG